MTSFIPFSGFIVFVLAFAALISSWGTQATAILLMCWVINYLCTQELLKRHKQGIPEHSLWDPESPLMWASLSQDLLAGVSVMILTGIIETNA